MHHKSFGGRDLLGLVRGTYSVATNFLVGPRVRDPGKERKGGTKRKEETKMER